MNLLSYFAHSSGKKKATLHYSTGVTVEGIPRACLPDQEQQIQRGKKNSCMEKFFSV